MRGEVRTEPQGSQGVGGWFKCCAGGGCGEGRDTQMLSVRSRRNDECSVTRAAPTCAISSLCQVSHLPCPCSHSTLGVRGVSCCPGCFVSPLRGVRIRLCLCSTPEEHLGLWVQSCAATAAAPFGHGWWRRCLVFAVTHTGDKQDARLLSCHLGSLFCLSEQWGRF